MNPLSLLTHPPISHLPYHQSLLVLPPNLSPEYQLPPYFIITTLFQVDINSGLNYNKVP